MRKFPHSYPDHLNRYCFAAQYCGRKKVLDAGSNEGFGAEILGFFADTITMADNNPLAFENAREWFKFFAPTTMVLCDFEKEFPDDTYDVVTAFELIEHLTPEGGDLFVKNVADHLVDGGVFIFSVPHMVANHEHKTLYDAEKIKALVSKYLDLEEFYVQDRKVISDRPLYKNLKCYVGVARKR